MKLPASAADGKPGRGGASAGALCACARRSRGVASERQPRTTRGVLSLLPRAFSGLDPLPGELQLRAGLLQEVEEGRVRRPLGPGRGKGTLYQRCGTQGPGLSV